MIICFNCNKRTATLLDELVGSGQYENYADAITSAVETFTVLQSEIAEKGVLVLGDRHESAETIPRSQKSTIVGTDSPPPVALNASLRSNSGMTTPDFFRIEELPQMPSAIPSLPDDVFSKSQQIPLDRWIFGQFNKLLPAKVNCRALARLLGDSPEGISIDSGPEKIALAASELGDILKRIDKQNDTNRDNTLAIAFPTSGAGSKPEKSRLRYASQFVASVNKHGQMSGLLIDLKLINQTKDRKPRLLLTEPGWRFAELQNPILDANKDASIDKFSVEERRFLINHICTSVPVEDFAYRTVLAIINDGATTPDGIDEALGSFVKDAAAREISDSYISTQRSGAISRMSDLDLVVRVRDGVRVSYQVTDTGKKFLQQSGMTLEGEQ